MLLPEIQRYQVTIRACGAIAEVPGLFQKTTIAYLECEFVVNALLSSENWRFGPRGGPEMGKGACTPLGCPPPDTNTYLDAHTGMCGSSWVGHKYWVIFYSMAK